MSAERSFDVLVIGGGPAGLAAAATAAEAGARTAIVDEQARSGGQIWRVAAGEGPPPRARALMDRVEQAGVARFDERSLVHVEPGFTVWCDAPDGPETIRAHRLILAVGARELFLPFPGWTRPSVMGAGGLQALAKSGLEVSGRRVVVAGSGPLLLAVAAFLRRRGARVVALCEQASGARLRRLAMRLPRWPRKLRQGVGLLGALRGIPRWSATWPLAMEGEGVVLSHRGARRHLACDFLACGFGLVPNLELPRFMGCALDADGVRVDQRQETSVAGVFAAGEVTGVGGVDLALAEGEVAGACAAGKTPPAPLLRRRRREVAFVRALGETFALRDELKALAAPDTIVCRCEDVPFAALESLASAREAKLQVRCGMGPCQARVCGAAARFLFGWEPEVPRPPLVPLSIDRLSRIRNLEAERNTP